MAQHKKDELKTHIIVSHDIETSVAVSDTVFILGNDGDKPGATIKKEIDLIERDLAWQKNIKQEKRFLETIQDKRMFVTGLTTQTSTPP